MSNIVDNAALYTVAVSEPSRAGGAPEDAKELRHHRQDGKGFRNPWDSWKDPSILRILRVILWRRLTGASPDTTPPTVPVHKPQFLTTRQTPQLRATWLGHACYLVEFPSGLRVLFDPVFTKRCSPFSWLGPSRYTEMPCEIEHIPSIDAVIISHNHYDHMSHPTILKIRELHPNASIFVPLGNRNWFTACGIHNVTELDWWEECDMRLSSVVSESDTIIARIGCLPCQHTSSRRLIDKNATLWASWSVESGGKKVWFGGDTGYRAVPELPDDVDDYGEEHNYPHCPAFKQIGDLRGPFDLGLIPIGAYNPRWFMSPMHANPFDSVNIFLDTKCKRALGMHWGTWVLTGEPVLEPPQLLRVALSRKNISEKGVFDVCDIGQSQEIVAVN
ncbi:hypothetical protein FGG08_000787 [Glutinoglossum americanum]|uniref:Metallo-beta-lactamase domain-containing protein n=1 Tax=Glutinoglossum americanum TaxID=1670608 RepID=A0A9P8L5U6_9PEZI|nr:hypothetical protein FGG08_000787 [Glutinoglossum americanum]